MFLFKLTTLFYREESTSYVSFDHFLIRSGNPEKEKLYLFSAWPASSVNWRLLMGRRRDSTNSWYLKACCGSATCDNGPIPYIRQTCPDLNHFPNTFLWIPLQPPPGDFITAEIIPIPALLASFAGLNLCYRRLLTIRNPTSSS